MSRIGHNGGPSVESGAGWRRYAWQRARRDLLPQMPIEVVRLRIRRARDLGIDYKSYASIRAATGRDIVALLFSSNALNVGPKLVSIPAREAEKLGRLTGCGRLAMLHAPLNAVRFQSENAGLIEAAAVAPTLADGWGDTREKLHALTVGQGLPGDAVVVIGDTMLEREWVEAGRFAGFLPSAAYFATPLTL